MHRAVDRGLRYLYAAASSGYLFTAGAFSRRNQQLIGEIARHFGYHRQGANPALPVVAPSALASGDTRIELRTAGAVQGNVTLMELMVITYLVRTQQPRRLFEIGTFDGRTTLALADNAGPEAEVFTLDLPRDRMDATAMPVERDERHLIDKAASGTRFAGVEGMEQRIMQLWGDSATFDYTPYEGRCDFVFVDGSHAYDYVLSDSAVAMRLIGDSGVIVWHDYTEWPGVTRALDHLQRTDKRFAGLRWVEGTTLAVLQYGAAAR